MPVQSTLVFARLNRRQSEQIVVAQTLDRRRNSQLRARSPRRRLDADHPRAPSTTAAARTRRSPRRSGCPKPPCASACSGCSTRASCRSSRSPTRCSVGLHRQAMVGIRVDGDVRELAAEARGERRDRLRRHLLGHLRPPRRAHGARRRAPARSHQRADPFDPGNPLDRNVRVPAAREADLHLGNVMSERSTDTVRRARKHLWMHFTRCRPTDKDVPVIERGEGAWVYDHTASKYLDGLAGLVRVAGRARPRRARRRRGQAGARARVLPGVELRAPARDRARGAPRRPRARRPRPRVLHDRRQRSGRVGVEAGPPVLPGDRRNRNRYKVISRYIAYHGTTMGALSITGVPAIKAPYEPLVPGAIKRRRTRTRTGPRRSIPRKRSRSRSRWKAPRPSPRCSSSRCRTRADASRRPTGYFQRVREICDETGVLLVSDEVICAFGRLGHWFGSRALRVPARHHHDGEGHDVGLLAHRRDDRPRAPHRAVPARRRTRSCTASRSAATR